METFLNICKSIGSALHWLTGWLIHPDVGGCCKQEVLKEQIKDQISEKLENLKK